MDPRRRRKPRSTVLPAPPLAVETPYANCRPEWQGVSLGAKTRVVLDSPAWRKVMAPLLYQLDAERPRRGPMPAYTSEELESAILFQKLAGVATYREARLLLASDREVEGRELLGFDVPRMRVGRAIRLVKSLDGVPCETTIWKHLQRWELTRHIAAYKKLFALLVEEHLQDPQMRAEARTLNIDGSVVRSHYTSWERVDRKTGEIKAATLDGGGYMARTDDNSGKDGHGFNMVAVSTSTGLPLAHHIVPLAKKGQGEADTAIKLFQEDWKRQVEPHLDPVLSVLTGDAAYGKRELRAELRGHGILENSHAVSHGSSETNKRNQRRNSARDYQIHDYPNWRANGHRELYCLCGNYKLSKRVSLDRNGRAVARVEGECKTCGNITITSGLWRVSQNPRRFVRCLDQSEVKRKADWAFGNPLTFNDPLAKQFGKNRFGHGEGFHGHLQTRFGLLKHKAWYRRREQAELDFLIVYSTMHALAMEQRARARAGQDAVGCGEVPAAQVQGPPGAQAAA